MEGESFNPVSQQKKRKSLNRIKFLPSFRGFKIHVKETTAETTPNLELYLPLLSPRTMK